MHADPNQSDDTLLAPSLRDVLYILFTYKWRVAGFFLTVLAAVVVYTATAKPKYQSEAKLLVRLGRESVTLDPTATTGQIVSVSRSQENEINSELEILRSPDLPRAVVEALGVERFRDPERPADDGVAGNDTAPASATDGSTGSDEGGLLADLGLVDRRSDLDKAVARLTNDLHIEAIKLSNVISLSYKDHDPTLARDVLSTLIDLFLEKHIDVHRTSGSLELFETESSRLGRQIESIQKELDEPGVETELAAAQEQRDAARDRLVTLERDVEQSDARVAASKAKMDVLRTLLRDLPEKQVTSESNGQPNPAADSIRALIYELRLKEHEVVSKYAEGTAPVLEVREQLAQAEALLEREESTRTTVTTGINPSYQKLQQDLLAERASLTSAETENRILHVQMEAARAKFTELDAESARLAGVQHNHGLRVARLQREIEVLDANYRKYTVGLEEARIDQAMQEEKISNISVYQPATLPTLPAGPGKLLNLIVGLVVAIFGSIAVAFLSEFFDHSIKRPEDALRKLALPCLASVPQVRQSRTKAIPERSASSAASYAMLAEQVRARANGMSKRPLVFTVTSSRRGEGVSTVAANLAAALARSGDGRTILVDADYRNPTVDRLFNIPASGGMTDLLSNRPVRIRPSPVPNLRLLLAGSSSGEGSVVFRPARYRELIDYLRRRYRFIVVDSPAVGDATSGAQIAAMSDGVVFVVESGDVRWEVAQAAVRRLHEAKARVFGVVLNKRTFPVPGWIYSTL